MCFVVGLSCVCGATFLSQHSHAPRPSSIHPVTDLQGTSTRQHMVSLARTVRNIRRVGLREWWRQMQYIGDAKSGRLVGTDR